MIYHNGRPQYKYVLFDLDDTLYTKEAGLMNAVGERIALYMTQKLGIPSEDTMLKRREYYQKYGTSLLGVMNEYNADPLEFLDFVHDVNPADFFGASPPLDRMLHTIPLRKVVFTNADVAHSERVLNTLRVRSHFEMIIDVQAVNFKSKPNPLAYRQTLDLLNVAGESCIMVEDKSRNLIPAKDLGMTTILVGETNGSFAIDYAVPTVFHVEHIIKNLLPMEGA